MIHSSLFQVLFFRFSLSSGSDRLAGGPPGILAELAGVEELCSRLLMVGLVFCYVEVSARFACSATRSSRSFTTVDSNLTERWLNTSFRNSSKAH
jgi:hypothetical protein